MDNFSIAYMNIALIKYWGKKEYTPYLIPLVPSISILSSKLYTKTSIEESKEDIFILNNKVQNEKKIFEYIDKIIPNRPKLKVISTNNMPTAAGLASSASGYAALISEINRYFKLNYSTEKLAKLASMGSGSAGRSFYKLSAFDTKGDIYPLSTNLDIRMSAVIISRDKKKISSREAMEISLKTSSLIEEWKIKNLEYFEAMKIALRDDDFKKVGELTELSTDFMHKTMTSSKPSFTYLTEESIEVIEYIKSLRSKGFSVYYTTDAGPNVKFFYLANDEKKIKKIMLEKYGDKIIDVV